MPELLGLLGRPPTCAALEAALAEAFQPHEGIVEKALLRLCESRGIDTRPGAGLAALKAEE